MDKTLLKGLAVLESVAAQRGRARTIEELASALQMTRSNVHRTLQTLAHAGYVAREDTGGSYVPTLRLFQLGVQQLHRFDVRRYAPPFMRELVETTGESVHLSALEGMEVVYIDKIDSPQPVRAYSAVGGKAPAYAVATGKAMLAHQPANYVDRYASEIVRHTPSTLASLPVLKEELTRIARVGYAVNRGEWRASVGGVAVAIFNGLDQVVAGLGISGPVERMTPEKVAAAAPLLRRCAAAISAAMGYESAS